MKATKARLDADRTAQPLTRLHVVMPSTNYCIIPIARWEPSQNQPQLVALEIVATGERIPL